MRIIDTHTHILPGVDDGIQKEKDALEALRVLAKTGVTDCFLTPHVAKKRGFDHDKAFLEERFRAFKALAEKAGIPVRLHLGSEVDKCEDFYETVVNAPSLNKTDYVLLDFGMEEADIEELVYTFRVKGKQVVVAHPERFSYMDVHDWEKVRKEGGILQLTAKHILKKGRRPFNKRARKLLKKGLCDLVASDLHNVEGANLMKEAYDYVLRKKGEEFAKKVFWKNAEPFTG